MATPRSTLESFIWGEGGAALTPEQIAARRKVENALVGKIDTSPVGHWTQGLARVADAFAGAVRRGQLDSAEKETTARGAADYDAAVKAMSGGATTSSPASIQMTGAANEVSATSPVTGDTFQPFMDTIKAGGVDNPYALAAIAATGRAESGWSAANANRTWSDPSESGKPGTAGGIMSWRGPRYQALAATGDLSPQGQANFFLKEDPALIEKLKGAKSLEEAQQLMNNAWAFAGYNRPGGESSRRLSYAQGYLPSFRGGTQVASLDPSAGMSAANAIDAAATPSGYVDPSVNAQNAQQAQAPAFDAGRFGPRMNLAQMPPTRADIPAQMGTQTAALTAVPALDAPRTVSPAPAVAYVPTQEVAQNGQYPAPPAPPSPPAPPQAPSQSPIMNEALLRAISSPYMTEGQRSVVQMLIQQQMQQQQQSREEQQWRARQDYQTQQQRADPAYQLEQQYRQAQIKALESKTTGGSADEWSLVPVWGKDKDGRTVVGQMSKSGKFKPLDTGDFQPTPGVDKVDTGTTIVSRDSKTGTVIDVTPKENYQEAKDKAGGGVDGKAEAEARVALSGARSVANQITSQIDDVLNDPNLDSAVGSIQGRLPSFRQGSINFDKKLERLQGQAFLQAREFLKGQGQITDFESQRAEKAMVQLSTAQSEDQFREALIEFKSAVASGLKKAEMMANQSRAPALSTEAQPASPSYPTPPAPTSDPNRVRKYNPATGLIE